MLHVTNGDCAVVNLHASRVPGEILAWRDALHDGAVPETESLPALSDIRARELAERGRGEYEDIREDFEYRDRTLESFAAHEEVVLWFEHDLYDQLQLLQILGWFSRQDISHTRLSLVQIGPYPGGPAFNGLGTLTGPQLSRVFPMRMPVTPRHLEVGWRAWDAFTASDPTMLATVATEESEDLPFLSAALTRLLEEYPAIDSGLARSEWQLLRAGVLGARHLHDYYRRSQADEDTPWGDRSLFDRIEGLADTDAPLLDRVGEDAFDVTPLGRRVLAGEADWLRERHHVDIRIGGVRVTDATSWRWTSYVPIASASS